MLYLTFDKREIQIIFVDIILQQNVSLALYPQAQYSYKNIIVIYNNIT